MKFLELRTALAVCRLLQPGRTPTSSRWVSARDARNHRSCLQTASSNLQSDEQPACHETEGSRESTATGRSAGRRADCPDGQTTGRQKRRSAIRRCVDMVPGHADLLIPLAAKMAEEPFKLLIMDSITSNLRVDFCGRGELAERQQKLGQMMSRLRKVRHL